MSRPGVYVSEVAMPRVVTPPNPTASYGAFIGTALRGPTNPVMVSSWSDFIATFGSFSAGKTLPLALYQYFLNGGPAAYVSRVLYKNATPGTKKFTEATKDRLEFTAASNGVWGNGVSFEIFVTGNDSFTLAIAETIRGTSIVAERFPNLSMDSAHPRYILNIVNSLTIGSRFVTVKDVSAAGDLNKPIVTGTTAPVFLTGGTDGTSGAPNDIDYVKAFDAFDDIDALLVFNVPGVNVAANTMAQKVQARGDSVLLIDSSENQPVKTVGQTVGVVDNNNNPANGSAEGSYAAVYYPWLYIADPHTDAPRGGIIKVPPGASVAGMMLRTDSARGVFKAPAGTGASLANVVASEFRLTNSELNTLAQANVNVIRPVPGSGLTVMGARTRAYTTDKYISVRRTLNYAKKKAALNSAFALFEPNTPNLWEQLRVTNGAWLSELWSAGGLAGLRPEQAYYVKCDSDINTTTTISNGEIHVEIGIAPVFPAEFIIIRVGQFESGASVVVTEEG